VSVTGRQPYHGDTRQPRVHDTIQPIPTNAGNDSTAPLMSEALVVLSTLL